MDSGKEKGLDQSTIERQTFDAFESLAEPICISDDEYEKSERKSPCQDLVEREAGLSRSDFVCSGNSDGCISLVGDISAGPTEKPDSDTFHSISHGVLSCDDVRKHDDQLASASEGFHMLCN
jgi:hypothetical protein